MYEFGRKPTKSQVFARVICHIAVKERVLSIEASLSETELERLADDALRRRWQHKCLVLFLKPVC